MLRDALRTGREKQSLFIHQYREHLSTLQPVHALNRPPNLPAPVPSLLPPQPLPPAATAAPPTSGSQAAEVPRPPPEAMSDSGAEQPPSSPKPSHRLQEQAPTRKPSHMADRRDHTHYASGGGVTGGMAPPPGAGGYPDPTHSRPGGVTGSVGGGRDRNRSDAFNKYNADTRDPDPPRFGLPQEGMDGGTQAQLASLLVRTSQKMHFGPVPYPLCNIGAVFSGSGRLCYQ